MEKYFQSLQQYLRNSPLDAWAEQLPMLIAQGLNPLRYGDLPAWQNTLNALPKVATSHIQLNDGVTLGTAGDCSDTDKAEITTRLRELIPWRKGPLTVHGTTIDTEWRSDWKWQRLLPHIQPLRNRLVLDVGCGNGYHCLRMLGEGAARVIGIDPSPRFVMQFYAVKHFAPHLAADVIPATLDDFTHLPSAFDTVFSMGVLYHRQSPMDHLRQLKALLRPGGELVLETLVIDGALGAVLVPEGRYAMMNNVWFIPSPATLISWLKKLGYREPRLVDLNKTSLEEQRSTEWMHFHSLRDFLDPQNPDLTVEGHPAPLRAIITASA